MMVETVLLDLRAAFDIVDHDLLLTKLAAYGSSPTAINWTNSYLSSRMQSVFFNGSFSSPKCLQCGVPQGSCLGPLLFSIFTNCMPYVLEKCSETLFANDTTVLNVGKTKSMLLRARQATNNDNQLCLSLRGLDIEQVQEANLFGVTLDSQLSWEKHIENIVKKMARGISCIRKCSSFLIPASRALVTQALVLSHLDDCSPVWSGTAKKDLSKLQIAQNTAARLALLCAFGVRQSTERMHVSLSLLRVEERLACSLMSFFKNIYNTKRPNCLYSQVNYVRDKHGHTTRQATRGYLVKKNSNKQKKQMR